MSKKKSVSIFCLFFFVAIEFKFEKKKKIQTKFPRITIRCYIELEHSVIAMWHFTIQYEIIINYSFFAIMKQANAHEKMRIDCEHHWRRKKQPNHFVWECFEKEKRTPINYVFMCNRCVNV